MTRSIGVNPTQWKAAGAALPLVLLLGSVCAHAQTTRPAAESQDVKLSWYESPSRFVGNISTYVPDELFWHIGGRSGRTVPASRPVYVVWCAKVGKIVACAYDGVYLVSPETGEAECITPRCRGAVWYAANEQGTHVVFPQVGSNLAMFLVALDVVSRKVSRFPASDPASEPIVEAMPHGVAFADANTALALMDEILWTVRFGKTGGATVADKRPLRTVGSDGTLWLVGALEGSPLYRNGPEVQWRDKAMRVSMDTSMHSYAGGLFTVGKSDPKGPEVRWMGVGTADKSLGTVPTREIKGSGTCPGGLWVATEGEEVHVFHPLGKQTRARISVPPPARPIRYAGASQSVELMYWRDASCYAGRIVTDAPAEAFWNLDGRQGRAPLLPTYTHQAFWSEKLKKIVAWAMDGVYLLSIDSGNARKVWGDNRALLCFAINDDCTRAVTVGTDLRKPGEFLGAVDLATGKATLFATPPPSEDGKLTFAHGLAFSGPDVALGLIGEDLWTVEFGRPGEARVTSKGHIGRQSDEEVTMLAGALRGSPVLLVYTMSGAELRWRDKSTKDFTGVIGPYGDGLLVMAGSDPKQVEVRWVDMVGASKVIGHVPREKVMGLGVCPSGFWAVSMEGQVWMFHPTKPPITARITIPPPEPERAQ